MPPIKEITKTFEVNTSNVTVLRLHGSNRSAIEQKTKGLWNQVVEPQDSRLVSAREMIHNSIAADADADVYVNVNNHYEGCAPLTIAKLLSNP